MTLTYDIAQDIVSSAIKAGAKENVLIAAVVVDKGGRVIAAGRSAAAGYVNMTMAERKAAAAVNFGAPTLGVLEMVKTDSVLLASVMSEASLSLLPGGMPIVLDGQTVGAVGIAGGHYSQDHAIAETIIARVSGK